MKYFTLVLFLFVSSWGYAQINLPIDFESTTINYVFTDFDGGQLTVESNPNMSGINTSANVIRMVKNDGQPWGGSLMELEAPIDFSVNKIFKIKVWAPAVGTKLLLKTENSSNGGIFFEQTVETTTANTWEELTFDFSGVNTAESYQKVVLIFENGTTGNGSADFTYYLDDIELVEGGSSSGIVLPVDFESSTIDYTFTDFDGGVLTLEDNPAMSGINTSAKVAKMVKNAGQPWGGSFFLLDAPIDFSVNKTFKMKVWAPAVGIKVLLKVENAGNGGIFFEKEEVTTTANAWEELTFDYSSVSTTEVYQKVVIIFENGTMGNGSADFTYYIDDINLVSGNPIVLPDLPITFEDSGLDYDLTAFEGNISAIVEDPTDPSNKVGEAIKTDGAQPWAGTTMSENGLSNPIPFSAGNTKMTVRVWSPDANIQIRLKVEEAGTPTISVETEATTTVAMAWETLEFDFSNEAMGTAAINLANTYNKISIFFNFGVNGATAGEKTYYWDDVMFGELVSVQTLDANEAGIKISPNPAKDFFNIEFPEVVNEAVQLLWFDTNGRLVKEGNVFSQFSRIDINDLTEGMYYLKIQTGEQSYFQKMVIVK